MAGCRVNRIRECESDIEVCDVGASVVERKGGLPADSAKYPTIEYARFDVRVKGSDIETEGKEWRSGAIRVLERGLEIAVHPIKGLGIVDTELNMAT